MNNIDKIKEIKKYLDKYDISKLIYDYKVQLEVLCKIDYILTEVV